MRKIILISLICILFVNCSADNHEREIAKKLNYEACRVLVNDDDSLYVAIKLLDSAIAIDSSFVLAYNNKLSYLRRLEDYKQTIVTLKAMEGRDDKNKSLYWLIGIHYEKIGLVDSAFFYYQKCIDSIGNGAFDDVRVEGNRAVARLLLYNEEYNIEKFSEAGRKKLNEIGIGSYDFSNREMFIKVFFNDHKK